MSVEVCNVAFEAAILPLISTIGYEGKVCSGVCGDCNGAFMIYPIGSNIVKSDACTGKQTFFLGHKTTVTCLDLDPCNRYLASGSMNYMGGKTEVILWDVCTGAKIGSYEKHLTRVDALRFSIDGRYLMSVGSLDDGTVAVYDTEKNKVICGAIASKGRNGAAKTLDRTQTRNDVWLVGGDDYLSWWLLDTETNRIRAEKANMKMIKRSINCIQIDSKDQFGYCGTSTGDIIKIKLNLPPRNETACGPVRLGPPESAPSICGILTKKQSERQGRNSHLYAGGITAMRMLSNGELLIGTGQGLAFRAILATRCRNGQSYGRIEEQGGSLSIRGEVRSILNQGKSIVIGSSVNELYHSESMTIQSSQLVASSHISVVNDICFPRNFSAVFASCSFQDVRIWNSHLMKELVRISVPNMTCNAVIFSSDGKYLITGWNDSNVRSYTPQTGTAVWAIHHAHGRSVTTLAITSNDRMLITGGDEGQVRVWSLCGGLQLTPIAVMKEHIGPITSLRMGCSDTEVASSSADGSIIIWCLKTFVRKSMMLLDSLFLDCCWDKLYCQILGVTNNHKLCYFEAFDGASIREIPASQTASVNSVDCSNCGMYIVTGGSDRQINLWSYNEAKLLRKGVLHSDEIIRVRFAPDDSFIISCCKDGSIFKWEFPRDLSSVTVSVCPAGCHSKLTESAALDGKALEIS